MYEFVEPKECDGRAEFANAVCKLIYQKHNGDLKACMKEAAKFQEYFDEYIRNIYELINREIPLIVYLDLITYGKDGMDLDSESEYEEALKNTEEACHKYYK